MTMLHFLNNPTTYFKLLVQQKLPIVCKTFFILTMLFIWQNTSNAQIMAYAKQQVPLSEKPTTILLKDALGNLKSHYKIDILFEDKVVKGLSVPSISLNFDSKIEKNLENILSPFGLKFKKVKDGAFLVMNEKKNKKMTQADALIQETIVTSQSIYSALNTERNIISEVSTIQNAQKSVLIERAISGNVSDSDNREALPGVSVTIKSTSNGTVTDVNGGFKLSIPNDKAILVFSFVGYEQQEIIVGNQTDIKVSLKIDTKALDEVVVVGYGTQKKSDVTGSVASVSRERLEQLPNTNIAQALQGAIPGLQINTNSGGAEGNDNSILIRGRNSISASTSPLIIWDGIPYTGGISEINPNDVESIEVLKDASAAAIYGARASNGVILVTSKQGKKGKLNITYDGFYGVQNIANKPNLMTGSEFYDFKKSRLNIPANSITPSEQAIYETGKAVDWYDLATQQGSRSQHTLSIAGGTDKISFYLGGTYLDVQGIAVNDQFKRYSIRPNVDIKVTPWLTIGSSTQFSFQDRSGRPADFAGQFGANVMNPLTTAFNGDGTPSVYAWPEYNTAGNPLGETVATNKDNGYRVFSANNVKIDFPFLKGLSYKLNTGVEYENNLRKTYYGIGTAVGFENKGSATNFSSIARSFTAENIFSYIKDFGKHSINITALYSSQSQDYDRDQLRGVGFPNDVSMSFS